MTGPPRGRGPRTEAPEQAPRTGAAGAEPGVCGSHPVPGPQVYQPLNLGPSRSSSLRLSTLKCKLHGQVRVWTNWAPGARPVRMEKGCGRYGGWWERLPGELPMAVPRTRQFLFWVCPQKSQKQDLGPRCVFLATSFATARRWKWPSTHHRTNPQTTDPPTRWNMTQPGKGGESSRLPQCGWTLRTHQVT